MKVKFEIVSEAKFATMEKDPRTFYRVITGSYSLSIGLWDNYFNLIETWEELQRKGLDLSKDYSDDPLDDDYFDKPGSGSAKDVLGDISGVLVVPDSIGKIGANALRGSGITGLTIPSSSDAADPGVVNVPSGTSVGANAFNGTGVSEANIPSDAGKVSGSAFDNTPAAQSNAINMGGHTLQNLEVDPDDPTGIILEKGYYYKVTALYNFVDDVTHESTIASSDESIVKFVPDCFLKAVNVGTAIISGTYTPPGGSKRYAEIECTVVNNGSGINTHVGGTPVRENIVEPTCTTNGSYDEVIYCLDCHRKLSTTSFVVPALGHNFENGVCTRCGMTEEEYIDEWRDEIWAGTKTFEECPEEYKANVEALMRQDVEDGIHTPEEFEEKTDIPYEDDSPGIYDENGELISTWDYLKKYSAAISDYPVKVNSGILTTNFTKTYKNRKYSVRNSSSSILTGKLIIGNDVTTIGNNGLRCCYGLKEVVIPEGVITIGNDAFNQATLTSGQEYVRVGILDTVEFPSTLRYIGDSAFQYTLLSSVTLPDNVERIGEYAFADTPLSYISLPSSLTSIQNCAFLRANQEPTVVYRGTIAQFNAITKGANWHMTVHESGTSQTWINRYIPQVECTDGVIRYNTTTGEVIS